jgi:hypothetical protein
MGRMGRAFSRLTRPAILLRALVVIATSAAAAGCATTPITPGSLSNLPSLAPGQARVIVIRPEKGFIQLVDRSFPIKLDGEPMAELMTGAFVYRDRPPGRHQLTAELWDVPGVTRHEFDAAPGRAYYFRARLNDELNKTGAIAIVSPLASVAATAATFHGDKGPIELFPMSEAEAKATLAALAQAR